VPVYHVSHMLGIFSIFNPDALSRINLIKGAYPARYGVPTTTKPPAPSAY